MQETQSIRISHDQNFLHLACIQSVCLGIPAIMIGQTLTQIYGVKAAISSIIIGNLILWLVALGIISMSFQERKNALQNLSSYISKPGMLFAWVVFVSSFINWFALQINSMLPVLGQYYHIDYTSGLVRVGAGIGFFTTLVALGGITAIKRIAVVTFPLMTLYYVYGMIESPVSIITSPWELSFTAIMTVVVMTFPGIVNFPTFFRHAQSKVHAYSGITVMTLFISLLEIGSIWIRPIEAITHSSFFSTISIFFIVWLLICVNLANIYFASSCWENIVSRFEGSKGYAVIGLLGTVVCTFIQSYNPGVFLANLTNAYLIILGVLLLIGFFIKLIVRHRPRTNEKTINSICLFIGCIVATIAAFYSNANTMYPLVVGVGAVLACLGSILFFEENWWAFRKIFAT